MGRVKAALGLMGGGLAACLVMMTASPAIAFHDETPTLEALKSGPNEFSAHAGDVITIHAQGEAGNSTCLPVISPAGGLEPLGEVNRTPNDLAQVFRVHLDGTYVYTLPTPLDETGGCSVSVGIAVAYEKLILEAWKLERNSWFAEAGADQATQMQQEALELYEQAIELEPEYPEPYKSVLGLLIQTP
ncbi:MAG: hypothetical protein F6K11_00205 [Leptolyngbya sp. SIO3F4]|nr:hypothetical protein [Leptolyngbya sp. SIO3F4]